MPNPNPATKGELKLTYLQERLQCVSNAFPDVDLLALKAAMIEGIEAFAYFKDGVQYVGTTGTTRKSAVNEIMEWRANAAVTREREADAGSSKSEGRLPGMSIDSGQTL